MNDRSYRQVAGAPVLVSQWDELHSGPTAVIVAGTGPRAPRRGAPYTFVTTETFLAVFGFESLRDLPDPEQLADAGLMAP